MYESNAHKKFKGSNKVSGIKNLFIFVDKKNIGDLSMPKKGERLKQANFPRFLCNGNKKKF